MACALQDVAEFVHFQCERVLNARVNRVALVVIGERLAGVGEEHRVAVVALGLQRLDGEVLLDDGVGMIRLVRAVEGIDLLAEHGTLEAATGLALLIAREPYG